MPTWQADVDLMEQMIDINVTALMRLTYARRGLDDDLLLCRQEYEVDVWAGTSAAHMVSDCIDVGGLRLPTKRRVQPHAMEGSLQRDVDIVTIDMPDYALR